MERAVSDRNILDDFCIRFCAIVDRHVRYIIVSGFLVISAGRRRSTEDIDLIIERLDRQSFATLHNDLVRNGFVCMQSEKAETIYDDHLAAGMSVRYTDKERDNPEMEVKFAKDELDRLQLKNRTKIPLTGLDVWFGSIEMNIAFKEEYLKSDKDLEDAQHLRVVFGGQIDEKKINQFKGLIRSMRL